MDGFVQQEDFISLGSDVKAPNNKQKTKGKKRKADQMVEENNQSESVEVKRKKKKVKLEEKIAQYEGQKVPKTLLHQKKKQNPTVPNTPKVFKKGSSKAKPDDRPQRRILFVGNLNFKTTKEQLQQHLEKVGSILGIRFLTNQQTGKSKGCAFVDVADPESVEKILLLHHTKLDGRVINVELTAGGGGNKTNRKQKIQKKNERIQKYMETKLEMIKDPKGSRTYRSSDSFNTETEY
eukprot:GCRY01002169.1.p1 GENE.GCRY01002169.1~~GCRY01002169.1.p1  ORF type:complete len:267 (-),score=48.61 GCRY01002169.1:52-759(-)